MTTTDTALHSPAGRARTDYSDAAERGLHYGMICGGL